MSIVKMGDINSQSAAAEYLMKSMQNIEKTNKRILIAGNAPMYDPGVPSEYFSTPVIIAADATQFADTSNIIHNTLPQ